MTTSGRLDNARAARRRRSHTKCYMGMHTYSYDEVRSSLKLGQPADVILLDMSPWGKL
jgi:hypothetical protein